MKKVWHSVGGLYEMKFNILGMEALYILSPPPTHTHNTHALTTHTRTCTAIHMCVCLCETPGNVYVLICHC